MNVVKTARSNDALFRAVFEAIPFPALIVDADVSIRDFNAAAAEYVGANPQFALHHRAGDALGCIHAADKGCGKSEVCKNCIIRNSVTQALLGGKSNRTMHHAEVHSQGKTKEIDLLVTATRIPGSEPPLAVLILEDITEWVKLQGLLPICAQCKKVRDDEQYWHDISQYLHTHTHLRLTHGLCPACIAEQKKALADMV